MAPKEPKPRQANGLPKLDQGAFTAKTAGAIILVSFTVGQCITWPIYLFGDTYGYDQKIDMLASWKLGWLYLALPLIYYTRQLVSMNASITRISTDVPPPHMYVYKVMTPGDKDKLPYVLLEEDGPVGRANRAQRGIDNLMEYLPLYVAYVLAGGFVFPFPVFVNVVMFMVSRITYARGYTQSAADRQKGFVLFGLTQMNMEGYVVIAAAKALLRQGYF
mmetsp:Transcript_16003/g.36645  ORF Transcript_16003/g.36645 Transcript_16003/m.36645 type:complete len:219 (+) Transcript_16003:67-723(+)